MRTKIAGREIDAAEITGIEMATGLHKIIVIADSPNPIRMGKAVVAVKEASPFEGGSEGLAVAQH